MNNNPLTKPFNYSYTNLTFIIIAVNILVFFFIQISPNSAVYLAMIPQLVTQRFFLWQFVSYMFLHLDFSHILFNMLGLFFFGASVERRMGSKEFLLFYLLTGAMAGVLSFLMYQFTGQNVALLGASGAVYAVLLAYATYYPDSKIFIFGVFPIKAPILVIAYTVIAVFNGLSGSGGNVANMTHLAGFIFAFLYFLIRLNINPIDAFRGNTNPWKR